MNTQRRFTRRALLRGAGIAIAGATGSLPLPRLVFAQTLKPVRFTLAWVAEGSNLFSYVAKGMGIWEKHGLDVSIAHGSGSVAAAQAIGSNQFAFGVGGPPGGGFPSAQGVP